MKHFKAVLFDLDGTLLDTLSDLADSMNVVLEAHGYPLHERNAYKYYVGRGVEYLVKTSLPPQERRPEIIAACVSAVRDEYSRRWDATTKPYEGITELLRRLAELQLQLAIFSNKPDDFTHITVKRFLPAALFSVIRGAQKGVPKKPDPTGAVAISKELDIAADQFLYLGDTDTDMQTAIAAGMFPVGVLWGFRPKEELVNNGAKRIIAHPLELLSLLGKR